MALFYLSCTSLFGFPCYLLSDSDKNILSLGIMYTNKQEAREVIIILNSSILGGYNNLLMILFLLWIPLKQLLGHTTFMGSWDPIYEGLFPVGHSLQGYYNCIGCLWINSSIHG